MKSSSKTVILTAPQAWGKTRNAEALRRELGCTRIVDDWRPPAALRPGALHLTNVHPLELPVTAGARVIARGW